MQTTGEYEIWHAPCMVVTCMNGPFLRVHVGECTSTINYMLKINGEI